MKNYHKQTLNPSTPSSGVEGMMNKAFFGKKKLAKKDNALKKAVIEKKAGQASVNELLDEDDD